MSSENYTFDNTSLASLLAGLSSFVSRGDSNASKYYTYEVSKRFGLPKGKETAFNRFCAKKKQSVFRNGTPVEQANDAREYKPNIEVTKVDTFKERVDDYTRIFGFNPSRKSRRIGGLGHSATIRHDGDTSNGTDGF